MKTVFLVLLLLSIALPAQALRCNGRLVDPGDHALQVRERCGEPFWIDSYSEWLISGERGPLERRVERNVEVWFYNFGSNRFIQRLVFRDDRLQHEESLSYGFDRASKNRCNLDTLPTGISNGEIIARCGPPKSRRERYADQIERDGQGNARVRVQRQEDWIYDTGASRDYRLLLIVDGRLYETERLDR
jgi:hypothetical protein